MPRKTLLFIPALTILWLHAAAATEPESVRIRAVLHDPHHTHKQLFHADPSGAVQPVVFRPQSLSEPFDVAPVNRSLVLYDKDTIDPENPEQGVAATARLPEGIERAIAVVLAAPADATPAYRILLIEDSARGFPDGESRVISLVNAEIALQAGEHAVRVQPGRITTVPPVRRVNDFNMAQTNFHLRQHDVWTPFAERQLQYLDVSRRIFIIHATPGALHPRVTTIVDTRRPRTEP